MIDPDEELADLKLENAQNERWLQGYHRDLRSGQRGTILPRHTWKRRWTHRRPSWSYHYPTRWRRLYVALKRQATW